MRASVHALFFRLSRLLGRAAPAGQRPSEKLRCAFRFSDLQLDRVNEPYRVGGVDVRDGRGSLVSAGTAPRRTAQIALDERAARRATKFGVEAGEIHRSGPRHDCAYARAPIKASVSFDGGERGEISAGGGAEEREPARIDMEPRRTRTQPHHRRADVGD